MIFLKFWWLLLVFSRPGSTWEDTDVEQFNDVQEQSLKGGSSSDDQLGSISGAVETGRSELQDLWPSFEDLGKQDNEKKESREARNTLDDMLASFAQTPVKLSSKIKKGERAWQTEADAWYRDLTKNGALKKRSDSKQVRSVRREEAQYVIDHPQDRTMEKVRPKYKEWSNQAIVQKHEGTLRPPQAKAGALSNLDVKLKQVQKLLSDQESLEKQERRKAKDGSSKDEAMAENLPDFGDDPVPDGVYERTLNRLAFSHPKSNKLNQKAFNKTPKFSRSSSLGKDNIKQTKRSSSPGFNPMDEIKLKTSIRLMRRGFGPLLPSSSLDISRNHMEESEIDRKELEGLRHQQFDSGQESVNMNNFNPQDSNFDYIQSNDAALNVNQMMELPKSYDMRMPHYDPLPNVLDYERDNRRSTDLDRFKREPGLSAPSLGAQDNSNLKSSPLEPVGEPVLKPSNQENKMKPLEGEEDLKVPQLGLSDTKEATSLDLTKERESKEEKLKESREHNKLDGDLLTKPESKLQLATSAVDGKVESKPESEFEAKLRELAAADGDSPSKKEEPATLDSSKEVCVNREAEVPNNESPNINSKSEEVAAVAKVENDDDILKVNSNLKPKEQEAKSDGEEASKLEAKEAAAVVASAPISYPDAVVKLMADEMSLYKNRSKRHARFLRFPRHGRRSKRSLVENADNDSLAHVYDPTKYIVPMMNQRPQAVSPPPPQQLQQQPTNRQPVQISNFKASFNLNNLFNEIQKLQSIKPPQQDPKQPVTKQPPLQLPVQKSSTQVTTKPTSSPIKSFGIHRFFGPFFKQLKKSPTTIDPNCVPITTPDGNSTTPEPGSANPPDNVCDSPDSVKVNVSINANVCGDPKTKQFYSNGSISVQPNKELPPTDSFKAQVGRLHGNKVSKDADMDKDAERHARRVAPEINEWELKTGMKQGETKEATLKDVDPGKEQANAKQTSQDVTPKVDPKVANKWNPPETPSDSYERLISGQLSKDIVAAVFEAVRNDPELTMLLPILERNLKDSQKQTQNHYQVQKEKTDSSFVNRQTCIPLRPDLQEFYDLVLKTADEEQKIRQKTQDEVLEKHLTGDEYTPRFVKLLETADSFKESGQQ